MYARLKRSNIFSLVKITRYDGNLTYIKWILFCVTVYKEISFGNECVRRDGIEVADPKM